MLHNDINKHSINQIQCIGTENTFIIDYKNVFLKLEYPSYLTFNILYIYIYIYNMQHNLHAYCILM